MCRGVQGVCRGVFQELCRGVRSCVEIGQQTSSICGFGVSSCWKSVNWWKNPLHLGVGRVGARLGVKLFQDE